MTTEPVAVTLQVIDVLDELGVPYAIGGSLASAWHGFSRTTIDSDIIAVLQLIHVQPFVQALKDEFYVDEGAMRDAISRRSSFNLIHLRTMFKVDIFVPKSRPFDRAQLANRRLRVVAEDPDRTAFVMGAEDTVLAKLEWYQLGGETSERQWQDVVGIVKVQGNRLDWVYMRQQARGLEVDDLLERLAATQK